MISDLITSVSVIVGALGIIFFNWVWLDPVGSIFTSALIKGGLKITKEALNILMEGTPKGYTNDTVKEAIQKNDPQAAIGDVKLWGINETDVYTLIRVKTSENMIKDTQKAIKVAVSKQTNIPAEHIFVDVN